MRAEVAAVFAAALARQTVVRSLANARDDMVLVVGIMVEIEERTEFSNEWHDFQQFAKRRKDQERAQP